MALTPMMQQYLQVKEKCKDCILFFRLGDFYEMFFEDAETASKELELVLTGRDCGLENRAPMCGIPFHAANAYIGRLINKGYKIAICEQLEDPSVAKGIVKRDIIKIITPGTYTDSSFLEETKNNFIMSLFINDRHMGISFADLSTGEFYSTDGKYDNAQIIDEIAKFNPREILLQQEIDEQLLQELKERFVSTYTQFEDSYFLESSLENTKAQFENYEEIHFSKALQNCCNGLLKYLMDTQKIPLSHINHIEYYNIVDYLSIDVNSKRNLELTETIRDKSKKGSLLWVIDKTCTAMGGRELRRWVERPLLSKTQIEGRLNAVEAFLNLPSIHEDLKENLKQIYDIERLVGKISSQSVNARELIALKNSIGKLPAVKEVLAHFQDALLQNIYRDLDPLQDIHELIDSSILDAPAIGLKEGDLIKEGFHPTIDELRLAKSKGKQWIADLENSEREATGIRSLKVGYNKVFGYYIEITKSNLSSVPEGRYIRKQTLSNGERYITPELKDMEDKILGAEEKLIQLEYEVFVSLRNTIEQHMDRMKKVAKYIAELDCLNSLAVIAMENQYCKPVLNTSGVLRIEEGRHPVVEKMISSGAFVANDTFIDTEEQQLLLITGPNMAGKSTYMRQVALITLLAQIGSYVPARSAEISICDRIFTRIGASDDLAAGKSTFMVEMWEVSNILQNATNRSLILLDEVGRGTSTYDGLSIAWAVIEYICNTPALRSKTLFATHYHELTKLERMIPGVKNYSVAVKECGNEILFLRKIIKGSTDDSYGIEVAKLAGLPEEVIGRAKEILGTLEKDTPGRDIVEKNNTEEDTIQISEKKGKNKEKKKAPFPENDGLQLGFTDMEKSALVKELSLIDILNLTPMDGLNKLYELVKKAKSIS